MYIENLSIKLLSKVTELNKDFQNAIIDPKISINPALSFMSGVSGNLKDLESKFNGNVQIVVSNNTFVNMVGPFTIPGYSTVVDWVNPTSMIGIMLSRFKLFMGTDAKIEKVGNTFNIVSSDKVVVYVPPWFLLNSPVSFGSLLNTKFISDDERVAVILHEIGHWDSTNSFYALLSTLVSSLGIYLGIVHFFTKKKLQVVKESNEKLVKTKEISMPKMDRLISIISGLFLYFIGANTLRSLAESGADRYASKFGYGDELANFVQYATNTSADTTKHLKTLTSLFSELIDRAKTGYPSINWRVQDLLRFNENEEYITELDFNFFNNIIDSMLIKLDNIISGLSPLHQLRNFNVQIKSSINENIDLLINESIEK